MGVEFRLHLGAALRCRSSYSLGKHLPSPPPPRNKQICSLWLQFCCWEAEGCEVSRPTFAHFINCSSPRSLILLPTLSDTLLSASQPENLRMRSEGSHQHESRGAAVWLVPRCSWRKQRGRVCELVTPLTCHLVGGRHEQAFSSLQWVFSWSPVTKSQRG